MRPRVLNCGAGEWWVYDARPARKLKPGTQAVWAAFAFHHQLLLVGRSRSLTLSLTLDSVDANAVWRSPDFGELEEPP